jgi:hypothetical protein
MSKANFAVSGSSSSNRQVLRRMSSARSLSVFSPASYQKVPGASAGAAVGLSAGSAGALPGRYQLGDTTWDHNGGDDSDEICDLVVPPFQTRARSKKSNRTVLDKRKKRPEILLVNDGILPMSVVRYGVSLNSFNGMLATVGRTSLHELLQWNAAQAIAAYGVLFLQFGFDSKLHGLGDAQVFIAALKRALLEATMEIENALIPSEPAPKPTREALKHWRDVEPYDFRPPVPLEVLEGVLGSSIIEGDFEFMMFVLLSSHCWLRPNEGWQLLWEDVSATQDEALAHGVVRIGHPKSTRPPVQHALMEAKFVAVIIDAFRAVLGQEGGRICNYTPHTLGAKFRAALVKLRIEKDLKLLGSQDIGSNVSHSLTVGGIRPGIISSLARITSRLFRVHRCHA